MLLWKSSQKLCFVSATIKPRADDQSSYYGTSPTLEIMTPIIKSVKQPFIPRLFPVFIQDSSCNNHDYLTLSTNRSICYTLLPLYKSLCSACLCVVRISSQVRITSIAVAGLLIKSSHSPLSLL